MFQYLALADDVISSVAFSVSIVPHESDGLVGNIVIKVDNVEVDTLSAVISLSDEQLVNIYCISVP